jgi:hypothetical protein
MHPLVTAVNNTFKNYKISEYIVVIDEPVVPFRGKLTFKQKILGKASKYGMRLFKLCDSEGNMYDVKLYDGKV